MTIKNVLRSAEGIVNGEAGLLYKSAVVLQQVILPGASLPHLRLSCYACAAIILLEKANSAVADY